MGGIDLEGYFFHGKRCVQEQLTPWMERHNALGTKDPWIIRVSARYDNESYQTVFTESLTSYDTAQIPNLLDAAIEEILKRHGPSPHRLHVRTRVLCKGSATEDPIDCKRLISSQSEERSSADLVILERENTRLSSMLRGCVEDLRIGFVSQGTTISALAESQTTLATARTVGSSGAEIGGNLGNMVALAGLAVAWPTIRETLGIPEGASLPLMLKMLQHRVKGSKAEHAPTAGAEREPFNLRPPPPLPNNDAHEDRTPVEQFLDQLRRDPELVETMADQIAEMPDLREKLLQAYLRRK